MTNSSSGIGFIGSLTIVFITLKLLGKITWSWWWVLSPIWITTIFVVVVLVIIGLWMSNKKYFKAKFRKIVNYFDLNKK